MRAQNPNHTPHPLRTYHPLLCRVRGDADSETRVCWTSASCFRRCGTWSGTRFGRRRCSRRRNTPGRAYDFMLQWRGAIRRGCVSWQTRDFGKLTLPGRLEFTGELWPDCCALNGTAHSGLALAMSATTAPPLTTPDRRTSEVVVSETPATSMPMDLQMRTSGVMTAMT